MTREITKKKIERHHASDQALEHVLILLNDEVHTFDYVIDALTELCEHTMEQAIQCTMITHYKGKCDVKRGSFKAMRRLRSALSARELNSIIQSSFS